MIALLLLACRPEPSCEPPDVSSEEAVFAAILSDFNVGGLALGNRDGALSEPIFATSGDTLVRVVDGVIYLLERGTVDALTAIDPSAPTVPLWQLALPEGANGHDLVGFEGRLWVPCFGLPEVLVIDPANGSLDQRIDLGSFAESADGNPELDGAVVADGRLWVAAQLLTDDPELPGVLYESEGGLLIELDGSGAVERTIEVGPNPRLSGGPGAVLVSTGLFVFPGASPDRATDGEVRRFDPTTGGLSEPLFTETGEDVFSAVVMGPSALLLTVDEDSTSRISCVDLGTGEVRTWPETIGWALSAADLGGYAVVGSRRLPTGEEATSFRFDPIRCERIGEPMCVSLDPYDLAAL